MVVSVLSSLPAAYPVVSHCSSTSLLLWAISSLLLHSYYNMWYSAEPSLPVPPPSHLRYLIVDPTGLDECPLPLPAITQPREPLTAMIPNAPPVPLQATPQRATSCQPNNKPRRSAISSASASNTMTQRTSSCRSSGAYCRKTMNPQQAASSRANDRTRKSSATSASVSNTMTWRFSASSSRFTIDRSDTTRRS